MKSKSDLSRQHCYHQIVTRQCCLITLKVMLYLFADLLVELHEEKALEIFSWKEKAKRSSCLVAKPIQEKRFI